MHRRSCLSIICIHRTTESFWSTIAMSEQDGVLMVVAGMHALAKKKTSGFSLNQSPCDERVVVTACQWSVPRRELRWSCAGGSWLQLRGQVSLLRAPRASARRHRLGAGTQEVVAVHTCRKPQAGLPSLKRLHHLPSRLETELSLAARWPVCECWFACAAFVASLRSNVDWFSIGPGSWRFQCATDR